MKKYGAVIWVLLSGPLGCAVDTSPLSDGAPEEGNLADAVPRTRVLPDGLQDGQPLPAYMTDEERAVAAEHPRALWSRSSSPPTGRVRAPAEFEATDGVFVRIPLYSGTQEFFGKLVHEIARSEVTPYLIVEDDDEADLVARYFLSPYGTDREDVAFLHAYSDAFWARDFGPYFIYVDGERAMVDMLYYPTRPNDDYMPVVASEVFDENVYSADLSTEGGNFMTDGQGTCWMSTGVLDANRYTQAQVRTLYRGYLGCNTVRFITPLPGEGTSHIDMFSKILSEDTILVAYSNRSLGANQAQINQLDQAARQYAETPKPGGGAWNIVRIPMAINNRREIFNAYTNSLIANESVLVPVYGHSVDSDALQVYRDAMPGYRVVGIPSREVIPLGGSVHCTTMQMPKTSDRTGTCGDGRVDAGERCDGGQVSCASLGLGSGEASCSASCDAWDTSACTADTRTVTLRASGVLAAGEHVIVKDDWLQASEGAFQVQMTGTGDADLYVWKDVASPNWDNASCRPYQANTSESCELRGPGEFLVAVRGDADSSAYELEITYTP